MAKKLKIQKEFLDELITEILAASECEQPPHTIKLSTIVWKLSYATSDGDYRRGWNDALAAVLHTCSVVSGQKESEA